jgi:hypothetical protein
LSKVARDAFASGMELGLRTDAMVALGCLVALLALPRGMRR